MKHILVNGDTVELFRMIPYFGRTIKDFKVREEGRLLWKHQVLEIVLDNGESMFIKEGTRP